MRERTPQRSMILALLIRAIHIVTLLAAGVGIGVLITSIKAWFIKRQQEKEL
jgi:hypothetical protein